MSNRSAWTWVSLLIVAAVTLLAVGVCVALRGSKDSMGAGLCDHWRESDFAWLRPSSGTQIAIDPAGWAGLEYAERELTGGWVSICLHQGAAVELRDARTSEILGRYDPRLGYVE